MKDKKAGDMYVIIKSKDLLDYIFTVTDKAPKKFRFTFVNRLQELALSIHENLFRANMVFIHSSDDFIQIRKRKDYQQEAYVGLKMLIHLAEISQNHGCILQKQYEQISVQSSEVIRLLIAWSKADQKRYTKG